MLPVFAYFLPGMVDMDSFQAPTTFIVLAYIFMTSKVLTSLLNAMFTSGHRAIFLNSEMEWNFQHCAAIFEFAEITPTIPPPFNFPIVLCHLMRGCTPEKERDRRRQVGDHAAITSFLESRAPETYQVVVDGDGDGS